MLDAVINRLKLQVPFLEERVEGAADFNQLIATNALAQVTPAAHVIPFGLRGGAADVATGLFRQGILHTTTIVLTIRQADRNGQRALESLDANLMQIIAAMVGWAPGDEVGVYRLISGRVALMARGQFVYELNFAIDDQLRIPT